MFSYILGLTGMVVGQMLKCLDYRREGDFIISFLMIICLMILLYRHILLLFKRFLCFNSCVPSMDIISPAALKLQEIFFSFSNG